jgi:hypothetical protein
MLALDKTAGVDYNTCPSQFPPGAQPEDTRRLDRPPQRAYALPFGVGGPSGRLTSLESKTGSCQVKPRGPGKRATDHVKGRRARGYVGSACLAVAQTLPPYREG